MEIDGNFVKFTAIGVYVALEALPFLAGRWKGKLAKELAASVDFFLDVITGIYYMATHSVCDLEKYLATPLTTTLLYIHFRLSC